MLSNIFMYCFQLQLSNYEHGLTLETGIYISKISPGSLAAKEGNLAVGDRVLSVSINSTKCVWVRLSGIKNSNLLREIWQTGLDLINLPRYSNTISVVEVINNDILYFKKLLNFHLT